MCSYPVVDNGDGDVADVPRWYGRSAMLDSERSSASGTATSMQRSPISMAKGQDLLEPPTFRHFS